MNRPKINHYFSAVIMALILFASSCKVQELEFKGVNDFSVGTLKSDLIEVTINVKLNNPNNFKIKVVNAKLDLLVGGNEAGTASLEEKIIIKKRTEDSYDITIVTDKEKLMSAALKSALTSFGSGNITIKVKGWVKGRVWGIGKKIDVEFKENVDLEKLKGIK